MITRSSPTTAPTSSMRSTVSRFGKWTARRSSSRDVAHVHDGYQVQTNSVSANGMPASLMMVRKTGGSSTLAVIDGVKQVLPEIRKLLPARRRHQADLRSIDFRQSRPQQRDHGRPDGRRA